MCALPFPFCLEARCQGRGYPLSEMDDAARELTTISPSRRIPGKALEEIESKALSFEKFISSVFGDHPGAQARSRCFLTTFTAKASLRWLQKSCTSDPKRLFAELVGGAGGRGESTARERRNRNSLELL